MQHSELPSTLYRGSGQLDRRSGKAQCSRCTSEGGDPVNMLLAVANEVHLRLSRAGALLLPVPFGFLKLRGAIGGPQRSDLH